VGDYHGVILVEYTPDKKYESFIDLTLFKDDKFFVTFFAKIKFNETYTAADSKFGYNDETTSKAKHFFRDTPFFEIPEKFSSFMPIRTELFFDLVKKTLKAVYKIDEKLEYFVVSDKEIEKYYAQNKDEAELISYDAINNYFYVCKSIFNCMVNKSEELIIDDYNFQEFPQILFSCTWIKKLELYELLISEIPETLTNLHNLKILSLKLKFLTKLPSSLHRLTNLKGFKLERTSLTELPDNLFELHNLKELQIISNEGIKNLPDKIFQLQNLGYLYAYSNEIKVLPKTLFRLEKLIVLQLADNKIEEIPLELTTLPNLKVLNLSGNKLKKIPDDLFEMKSIEEIQLSNNPMLDKNEIYDLLMKSGRSDKIHLIA
jgi:Leucine-rich repeat (LRR) protein